MFKWLSRKKPTAEVVQPPKPLGFFSTDSTLAYTGDKTLDILSKSFQVTARDFQAYDESGKVAVGMDAAENMASVKLGSFGGYNIPLVQLDWYAGQGFIGYQTCAIIAQNWLVEKACEMPAKDAARHGYEITVNDGTEVKPEIIDEIRKLDKKYAVKNHCVRMVKMGRVFGIRIVMFKVESKDPLYYEKPFNPDGITPGSYKGIAQIDPYWITPELSFAASSDPTATDYFEPTWWRVNGRRIHRSHLVIFRTGEVADILKPTYMFGGVSVPQRIAERVYASERTANEAPQLAMSKRMTVLNVDVAQALANADSFSEKMRQWMSWVSNFGVKIIGGEEKIEQFDTTLANLDDVIMSQFQLVSAASGVPATKLLGTTPKGFNSSGEYEEKSYHEECESIQEHDMSPLVERHHLLLIRSEIAPKYGIKPFSTDVNWKPVDSPTAMEQADLNNKKADTDSKLSAIGAIDGFDVRNRLIADPDSGYNGIDPIVPGGPGDREAEREEEEDAKAADKA